MVTSQEQIDTNSPVVPYAILQKSVELHTEKRLTDKNSKMMLFKILFCHVLLLGIALSSPVETKVTEKKLIPEPTTTHTPLKVNSVKNVNNEQVQNLNNAQTEKSATKKRNVPEVLPDKNEYFDDDFYEGKATDDYDGNQALRTYLDNTRKDNFLFDSSKYRGNDYRYYDDDSRRKRTAAFDEIFKTDNYREPEIRLSPEDLMVLAAYRQQHRLYNGFPYGRWNDVSNSIDLPDTDMEGDDIYERPENFFDRYYDQRYQNWANLPRSNKYILNRQRRSYSVYPKLRVPLYKRAIL